MKKGSIIMITGGTGSFGGAVVERFLKKSTVKKIIIFSRDEKKQHDMMYLYDNNPKLNFVVGDVRDLASLEYAMKGVDYVFHAAALKQVPTGEFFPMELVRTNILGTENVFIAAEKNRVEKVILLSTDKSVQPINAMGMTKAIAEKLLVARARKQDKTIFCAVRYGNVASSRGSVIPLFIDRIKAKKTIPVTLPHMTRFLLSLDDAVDLVEFALSKGKNGDILVKKAPAATVQDLARALLDLFKSSSKIEIVGARGGEKIHELLAHHVELQTAEDMDSYFRIPTLKGFDYKRYFDEGDTDMQEEIRDYSSENTHRLSLTEVKNFLRSLPYVQNELKNSTS